MDELIISERRFISAKRAAEEYEYNPDYIGQLIRSKKIHGTKVGRAWYVDAEQIENFFSRAKKISDIREVDKVNKIIEISHEQVEADSEPAEVAEELAEEEKEPEVKKEHTRYVHEVSISLPHLTKKEVKEVERKELQRGMSQDVVIKSKTPARRGSHRKPVLSFVVIALISSAIGYAVGDMFVTHATTTTSATSSEPWHITTK